MELKNLHYQKDPLLICNVWDVASTKAAEKTGFRAIGTSSAAIANMLGYPDGEQMSFSELIFIVKRILACTRLPVSIDIESGYSRDPQKIARHIRILAELGVSGVNIEDSINNESGRILLDPDDFAEKLKKVKSLLQETKTDIFLNVRTDTFLSGKPSPVSETINRINLYENAGADGIFVPCIEKEEDIQAATACTKLPLNVMCMPNLPDFIKLKAMGVKRISMGNFLFENIQNHFQQTLLSVLSQKSFNPVFRHGCNGKEKN